MTDVTISMPNVLFLRQNNNRKLAGFYLQLVSASESFVN